MQLDKLNGEQREKLHAALLSAFPTPGKLKQMVNFKLNQNLDAISRRLDATRIAGGANHSEVVSNLIVWAKAEGRLEELLTAARKDNPGNTELKRICEELSQGQTARELSHALMNPCNFDLTELMEICCEKLVPKKGLVGIGLPCEDYNFLDSFCQRLLDEFKTINIKKQPHLSLNSKHTPVSKAIKLIQQCKKNLKTGDIIYPIQISNVSTQKQSINDFWQQVSVEFKDDDCKHRLIIIMWGSEDSIFQKPVIKLDPPKFKTSHVFNWIRKVSLSLEWGDDVMVEWNEKMIKACLDEREQLNIDSVYYHLNNAINLLKLKQNHVAETFLQELEI